MITGSINLKRNISHIFEWNEGNHFQDADIRTAKAFLWTIKEELFELVGGIKKGHPTEEEIQGAVRFYEGLQ